MTYANHQYLNGMNKIMKYSDIYFKIKNKRLQNLLLTHIVRKEGGYPFSQTIREIFKRKHNIDIGYGSYGCFDYSHLRPNITIGNYCSFGPGVRIFRANHRMDLFTTHPIAYGELCNSTPLSTITQKELVIGHDVWIGANSIILPGCEKIGDGAIIGAGSIVTKDILPYSIVVGNPAHLLRKRFKDTTIAALEKTEWWNLNYQELNIKMKDIQVLVETNEQ